MAAPAPSSTTSAAFTASTMICNNGAVGGVPGVDNSQNWCSVSSTNASNSPIFAAMTACCDSETVTVLNGCQWCNLPADYLGNGSHASGSVQNMFNLCYSSARQQANVSGVQGIYCNQRSSAVSWRYGGQHMSWMNLGTLFLCLSFVVVG